jgi:hypothetical protein
VTITYGGNPVRGRVLQRRWGLRVSQCAMCERAFTTRYGFRAHMRGVHGYVSKAHALPGTGRKSWASMTPTGDGRDRR